MVAIIRQNLNSNQKIFSRVKKQLKSALGLAPIIHVGSTAIPRMYGKNIIDVLVGAENTQVFNELTEQIAKLGFFPSDKSKTSEYLFFASRKEETRAGDIHIHLVILGTERYNDFIYLKNYLLDHPETAREYSEYKRNIATTTEKKRHKYKEQKSQYVCDLIKKAREHCKLL